MFGIYAMAINQATAKGRDAPGGRGACADVLPKVGLLLLINRSLETPGLISSESFRQFQYNHVSETV
ncbi:Pisatin demethylase [Fusarium oxysporum f. sp. albedinis]|nr:Pisatin demethylase [Fusarium oxysporum f. sp. albedinis]